MQKYGKLIFWVGMTLSIIMGLLISIDPGFFCDLDSSRLPETIWSFQALCFVIWAFSVPLGVIIAATGIMLHIHARQETVLKFGLGTLSVYLFISFGNGPMPHIPSLFGIGGALILLFYFLIVWQNAASFKKNALKLAAYTFLTIGFWFSCGLASRPYQPALGAGESPIDIMTYFVLAMLFFWLNEQRQKSVNAD